MEATIQHICSLPGQTVRGTITKTATAGLPPQEVPLPAGVAGTLSTRTDDDTAVITAAGHSLQQDDKVDVYWAGGRRYGMTVSSVDGNNVTVGTDAGHVGNGDAFPAQDTAVVITEQVVIDLEIDGDALVCIAAGADQRAHLEFHDGVTTSIAAAEIPAAGESWSWVEDSGYTNPLAGDVTEEIRCSNGSTTAATLKLGGLYNSTS